MVGLLGKKLGMTQIFNENGEFVPITVIEAGPCPILADELKFGQQINVDLFKEFKENEYVDITGHSIGRGFQGVVKRHNFRGGPGGHGSTFHRAPGSIGSMAGGRGCRKNVRKGQRMPGRMGGKRVTVQNLKIVKIDAENNLVLVKGPVPGYDGSYLVIRKAKKKVAKR